VSSGVLNCFDDKHGPNVLVDGIAVTPPSAFRIAPAEAGGLVIGYGRLHQAAVEPATDALAKIVRAVI
jgi:hypothetical protein